MITFYFNRILVLEELEPYVYNKCAWLYSILCDGWRQTLKLSGRGYQKNILRDFLEIDAPNPEEWNLSNNK